MTRKTSPAEIKRAKRFTRLLLAHAKKTAKLYDGMSQRMKTSFALTLAAEELGEVASAVIRGRQAAAKEECLDLAHTAFLIWQTLEGDHD